MSDLIDLNCPDCGSHLKVESTKMKATCQFCGAEVLIKDFITERRVDKEDKILSLNKLIENAKNNKDYISAYKYYEEICKLEPTKENLLFLNLFGFYSDILDFQPNWITKDLYILSPDEHRKILNEILLFLKSKKHEKINKLPYNLTPNQRKDEINRINVEFAKTISFVSGEIQKMKIRHCKCGAELEYNVDFCPECGTNYIEYQKEILLKEQAKKRKYIKLGLIIGIPIIIIIIIFSFVYNGIRVNSIKDNIESGNYLKAESLIEEYQKSNSSQKEPYELYAELYLAQNQPEKAIEKLESGLNKVSSNAKEELQTQIDEIQKEYNLN